MPAARHVVRGRSMVREDAGRVSAAHVGGAARAGPRRLPGRWRGAGLSARACGWHARPAGQAGRAARGLTISRNTLALPNTLSFVTT